MNPTIMTLAQFEARRIARERVKEKWRAEGRKLWDYHVRDVTEAADAYLDQHRDELIGRACANLLNRAQRKKR